MQVFNVILVFSSAGDQLLLCRRRRDPFRGLSNLVGGHIEPGETGEDAAYRELWEETAIGHDDISLRHVMDFTYHFEGIQLEVWAGRLRNPVEVRGEENELYWSPLDRDFFDTTQFAGDGNIGHMLVQVQKHKSDILGV